VAIARALQPRAGAVEEIAFRASSSNAFAIEFYRLRQDVQAAYSKSTSIPITMRNSFNT
jgi:hypothetical protein